jgi:hypothetical protein
VIVVDPAIQERYDRNAAAYRSSSAAIAGELRARQAEVAGQIERHREEFAAIGRRLAAAGVDQPRARRPEDDDISAMAAHYQEAEEEEPPPPQPPPVRARPAEDEDLSNRDWFE